MFYFLVSTKTCDAGSGGVGGVVEVRKGQKSGRLKRTRSGSASSSSSGVKMKRHISSGEHSVGL